MRSSGAMVALLVASRCFVEAVTFSALAALAHAAASPRSPMPVLPTTLVLFGVALLLVTVLRETGAQRKSATVLVLTLAGAVAWGLALPMRDPDWFAVLSRVVAFAIVGEGFLWRLVSIARGATRWTDARNAVPLAAFAIALAVLLPGPIDRAPFPALTLLVVAVSGLALSLARTTEELSLSRGTSGEVRASSATSTTVIVGVFAILAAAFVPAVQDGLGAFGAFLAPIVSRLFYLLILPFAYLAGFLIEFLRPLIQPRQQIQPPRSPQPLVVDEELMRQIEQTRPFVFGALELIVVAIAALFAILLLDRMLRERRMELPEGVTLEREPSDGIGLLDALRGMRPRARRRRHAPHDDGTAAAALRLLYWRFLQLAERRGAGWRDDAETPAEHETRIAGADPRWRAASPVVRGFEDLRYGEVDPAPEVLDRAREALGALETSTRTS